MTIVDVLLHKWRMLNDSRRKLIIGLIALLLIALLVVIFTSTSKSEPSPDPNPDPNPDPPTTAPPSYMFDVIDSAAIEEAATEADDSELESSSTMDPEYE